MQKAKKPKEPKKWTEVYPQGTKEGDEEAKFFKALARTKWDWRSIAHLVKETGLTRERVEEIIDKYHNKVNPPIVYPHNTNPDMWGYWERVPDALKKDVRTIAEKDQDGRINGQINPSASGGCNCGANGKCSNCATPSATQPIATTPGTMPNIVQIPPGTVPDAIQVTPGTIPTVIQIDTTAAIPPANPTASQPDPDPAHDQAPASSQIPEKLLTPSPMLNFEVVVPIWGRAVPVWASAGWFIC